MTNRLSLGLIGAGAMGGALLRAWLKQGVVDAAASAVFDPVLTDEMSALLDQHGVAKNPPVDDTNVEYLILAIKPQMATRVLPVYGAVARGSVSISVMAGKSISSIAASLQGADKIIRAMPNLPASIGEGMTGLFASSAVSDKEREGARRLMQAAGDSVWVESEAAIDAVTAISGSGPAYFFLLTEILQEVAEKLGLSPDVAERLARQTLIGAGALLAKDQRSAEDLRISVTSPGGTTAAALGVFDGDDQKLRQLVMEAAKAAADRAKQLTE